MKIVTLLKIVLILILFQACATTELWKKINPEEYVQISMNEISENELKEKGIKYYKNENKEVFYLEKSSVRKLGDYSLRILLTPLTVVLDVTTVIVVGSIMIIGN